MRHLPINQLKELLFKKGCRECFAVPLDDGSFIKCYRHKRDKFIIHQHTDLTFEIYHDNDGLAESDKIEVLRMWLNHEEPERVKMCEKEIEEIQVHAIINFFESNEKKDASDSDASLIDTMRFLTKVGRARLIKAMLKDNAFDVVDRNEIKVFYLEK